MSDQAWEVGDWTLVSYHSHSPVRTYLSVVCAVKSAGEIYEVRHVVPVGEDKLAHTTVGAIRTLTPRLLKYNLGKSYEEALRNLMVHKVIE